MSGLLRDFTPFGMQLMVESLALTIFQVVRESRVEPAGSVKLAAVTTLAVGALAGVREYAKYQSGHSSGPGRLVLAICFTVSFAWFGLSSFWRVRRKSPRLRAKS